MNVMIKTLCSVAGFLFLWSWVTSSKGLESGLLAGTAGLLTVAFLLSWYEAYHDAQVATLGDERDFYSITRPLAAFAASAYVALGYRTGAAHDWVIAFIPIVLAIVFCWWTSPHKERSKRRKRKTGLTP